jgi:threonine dehydratase
MNEIFKAHNRIKDFIHQTPLMESSKLNNMLGHRIIFKMENLQKTGSFKSRGALNKLLTLKEKNNLPKEVVAFSSGNHAQGVAWAANQLGVNATIFLPEFSSEVKKQATRGYGSTVIETGTRREAEKKTEQARQEGAYFIHPFDDEDIITGQGTACFEALQEGINPDAVFTPLGGGGLTSGTHLSLKEMSSNALLFAGEPTQANDASISYKQGSIFCFGDSPQTIADGAKSLGLSPRTFDHIKQIAGIFEISEDEIIYWSQWLMHLLKTSIEPTSALAMSAAHKWLGQQNSPKEVLIIISGGNIASDTYRKIFATDLLCKIPTSHHLQEKEVA